MNMQKCETLLFTGYARLPENIASRQGNDLLTLELEVDLITDLIVDASCSCIPALGQKFILDLLIGYDLKQTLGGPKDEIQRYFRGPAKRAVIAALEKAYAGYLKEKNSILKDEKSGKSPQD